MKNLYKIYWLNLSQNSLNLVEYWACRAVQFYTANAIFRGQTKPRSIFQKPPSPSQCDQHYYINGTSLSQATMVQHNYAIEQSLLCYSKLVPVQFSNKRRLNNKAIG